MSKHQDNGSSRIRVTCLADNTAELSSPCWAEHGISFLIETEKAKVLFDTGQSGDVLGHNLSVLGKDLRDLSCVILSHGHYDHTGGLEHVLSMCPGTQVIGHPELFSKRFSRQGSKPDKAIGIPFTRERLEADCRLRLVSEPVEVTGTIMTSGQIPRGYGPEPRSFRELVDKEGRSEPDPFLDDQCLILKTERGLVVLLGCCHAGLVNTLAQVDRIFQEPICVVMGGTHLAKVDQETLRECVATFSRRSDIQKIYAGHCTGPRGFAALSRALGERVQPCSAGLSLEF